jgi:glutamate racemase
MAKENCHRRVQEHPGHLALKPSNVAAASEHPIGVFDSGVGGLSVLRALQAELPQERFVYVADNGHAPYGDRGDTHVIRRSHAIADYLSASHGIKALVVACNTATAAAIHTLRAANADLPIIGIEPALKPASASSKSGVVGVMATRATLHSEKFARLLDSLQGRARFNLQPCDGLADAIERSDTERVSALCATYTQAMGRFGSAAGEMDTLVLGCTHYPFVADTLQTLVGPQTALLEGGTPVARHTRRLLEQSALARTCAQHAAEPCAINTPAFYSTGNVRLLDLAVQRWLGTGVQTQALDLP